MTAKTNEWQPIETAPKDGTKVLGWTPEGIAVLMRWESDGYWNDLDKANDYERQIYPESKVDPTHWMPLPAAPEPLTEEEDGHR